MTAVFVYGTLRPGGGAFEALLAGRVEAVTPAELSGYGLRGRGRRYPYVVAEPGGRVRGELVTVDDRLLPELDAYEGSEYRRERMQVETDDDDHAEAWVYVAREEVEVGEPIPSGDWLAR